MTNTCECETTLERAANAAPCQECGTACCRSCALKIETQTYCRWCATSLMAA